MAYRTRTQYKTLYGTSGTVFPDNTTGEISESDMRAFGEDGADSIPFTADDSYSWPFPQATASGTNTYTATVSPAISAYFEASKYQIKFTNGSSGVSTLNLNSVGAKKIFINPTTQATTGHIVAGQIYILAYDEALDAAAGGFLIIGSGGGPGASAAEDVSFTPAGSIAATDVQAAIVELDSEKATVSLSNLTGKYVIDQTSASTAGGTITLNMNSQIQRSFVGSATFAAPKTMALSNTTNSLFFNFFFEITNMAAELTFPSPLNPRLLKVSVPTSVPSFVPGAFQLIKPKARATPSPAQINI